MDAGITTVEDLFTATEKTLSVLKDERFFGMLQWACKNVQRHTFILKESTRTPKHLLLKRKLKNKEEKLIHLGMSIFDPIFKSKKIARNALLGRLPQPRVDEIQKREKMGTVRIMRTHKIKYKQGIAS